MCMYIWAQARMERKCARPCKKLGLNQSTPKGVDSVSAFLHGRAHFPSIRAWAHTYIHMLTVGACRNEGGLSSLGGDSSSRQQPFQQQQAAEARSNSFQTREKTTQSEKGRFMIKLYIYALSPGCPCGQGPREAWPHRYPHAACCLLLLATVAVGCCYV